MFTSMQKLNDRFIGSKCGSISMHLESRIRNALLSHVQDMSQLIICIEALSSVQQAYSLGMKTKRRNKQESES
ncbi:hypothetical protein WN51_05164 [Melipona quadrifasciata]|uniref:Uncharacterized protein n=1 Tax=Melipona quadrifasciata TaxID=166423 RepID=A0A0M8ZU78_9HYME|nr:hypothetical protein WN51_05164 [Melipona quadrifasciata]